MKDLPRTTGNVFFIYANAAAGGTPTVRVAPSISAKTGLASVSGELSNGILTITPNTSGGFSVILNINQAKGFFNFNVTATTNGDSTHEAATVTFTFYVVLVGSDEVFDFIKREYRVGDEVNEQIQLAPANGIHDYRVTGGSLRAMDVDSDAPEYASGITVSIRTISNVDQVWLSGRAKRPGCYLAWLDCTTWDSGGGATYFSGGSNMAAPVIVSIRDRNVEPGTLCVMLPQTVSHNANALRLIMCNDDVFPNMGGWFRVRMSGGSGVWSGQYQKPVYNGIEYHDYRVELSGQTWTLKTRAYHEDDTPPEWSTLATAPAIIGTEWISPYPPSSGWSDGAVMTGDTWYNVPGQGMFDHKGEYQERPVYQEQCIHTRQYSGWTRGAEYQNNAGRLLWQDGNGKWNIYSTAWAVLVEDVTPQGIDGAAIPYAPPVMEKIGSDPVRDLSFGPFSVGGTNSALNVNNEVSTGALALFSGGTAGGIFSWFDAARLIVPYNGSSGDRKQSGSLSCSLKEYVRNEYSSRITVHQYDEIMIGEPLVSDDTGSGNYKSGVELGWSWSGVLPFGTRDNNTPIIFGTSPSGGITASHNVEGGTSRSYYTEWFSGGDTETWETTYKTKSQEVDRTDYAGQLPLVFFYPFSAPDADSDTWHQIWFAARLVGGGAKVSWVDERTTVQTSTWADPTTTTEEITGSRSTGGRYHTAHPVRFDGAFMLEGQTDFYEEGTFTATAYTWTTDFKSYDDYEDIISDNGWYELTITKKIRYTAIGGKRVGSDTNISWTKKTRPAGTYSDGLPPYTTTTGNSTEFSVYEALVKEAKDKVAAYVAPGAYGRAEYEWRDNSTVTELSWG